VAPPGFLLIEKGAVAVLGNSEWSLRLFPLLCGIASIAIIWLIARWMLEGWAVTYAVGLFALATPLVFFSSQVKQYSSDAAATLAVTCAAIWLLRAPHDPRRVIATSAAGVTAVWISQPVVFVLLGASAALMVSGAVDRRAGLARASLVVIPAWVISAAVAASMASRNVSPADRDYLQWYWSSGLMPRPLSAAAAVVWAWQHLTWLFGTLATGLRRTSRGLGYPWSQMFVALTVVGVVAIWRKRHDLAVLLALPVMATLVAAALHVYPFAGRVVTFLLPLVFLLTAAGADHVVRVWCRQRPLASAAALAVLAGSPLFASLRALPPARIEHIRPVLARVTGLARPDDDLYVYYAGGQSFLYYAERFDLGRWQYVIGRCSVTDPRQYLQDLDRFRGRARVWIVATHARFGGGELAIMFRYLDSIGRRLETIEERATSNAPPDGAFAVLYDLADRTRLGAATAETFPVPDGEVDAGLTKWGCYGTQSASRGL